MNPSVFDKTYEHYLNKIQDINLISVADKLNLEIEGDQIKVLIINEQYMISKKGIFDIKGKQPSFEICIIIFKYIILCPEHSPQEDELVTFRDFKDSGPLITYFSNEVELSISNYYSGRLEELKKACKMLGGHSLDMGLSYDLMMRFDALSKVSVFLFFDDKDEEFPAKCSILFEKRAESYLDAECLAILGRLLFTRLSEDWNSKEL